MIKRLLTVLFIAFAATGCSPKISSNTTGDTTSTDGSNQSTSMQPTNTSETTDRDASKPSNERKLIEFKPKM